MIEKPYTLVDYDKEILQDAVKRFAECHTYELISGFDMQSEPLTRWQKFKYRLKDYKQRAKDIWTILTDGDIHDGCC